MELNKTQRRMIAYTNRRIWDDCPDAHLVAVVWLFLDCHCMKAFGISIKPEVITPIILVTGESLSTEALPDCEKCKKDYAADPNRIIDGAIVWFEPGPDQETRRSIEREVFGPQMEGKLAERYGISE